MSHRPNVYREKSLFRTQCKQNDMVRNMPSRDKRFITIAKRCPHLPCFTKISPLMLDLPENTKTLYSHYTQKGYPVQQICMETMPLSYSSPVDILWIYCRYTVDNMCITTEFLWINLITAPLYVSDCARTAPSFVHSLTLWIAAFRWPR